MRVEKWNLVNYCCLQFYWTSVFSSFNLNPTCFVLLLANLVLLFFFQFGQKKDQFHKKKICFHHGKKLFDLWTHWHFLNFSSNVFISVELQLNLNASTSHINKVKNFNILLTFYLNDCVFVLYKYLTSFFNFLFSSF